MVSEPCQTTWFSYEAATLTTPFRVSEPCQITLFSYSPGLVLTRSVGFRAVSNHLVLLPSRIPCGTGSGFRAVPNYLVLLLAPDAIARYFVSQPCQIIWFSYASSVSPASEPFHSRVRSPGSLTDGYGCHLVVSEPCQTTWFSYRSSRELLYGRFYSRVKSPGPLTHRPAFPRCAGFRVVPNHLVLLHGEPVLTGHVVSWPCRTAWFSYLA